MDNAGAMTSARNTRISGFTLVEMLVVIAVIAILASLLLPALGSIQEKGRNAQCVNNLRQMGVGLMLYVGDHDGALIPGAQPAQSGGRWYNVLDAYMGNEEQGSLTKFASGNRPSWQRCPSKVFNSSEMNHVTVGYGWNYYGDNAGHDGFGNSIGDSNGRGYGSRLVEVTKPSKTIIIGDSKDLEIERTSTSQNVFLYPPPASVFERFRAKRHSGRGNYLMVDGHVESLPPDLNGYDSYFNKVQ